MKLGFQELLILLVRVDMCINSFTRMHEKLLLKSHSEIESNIISIRLNSKGEEINLKFNFKLSQILKSQSKLSAHDENLDSLICKQEFFMSFEKLGNIVVGEKNSAISKFTFTFVCDQYRDEIYQLNKGLLVKVYLSTLNFDQFITNVFIDVKHNIVL